MASLVFDRYDYLPYNRYSFLYTFKQFSKFLDTLIKRTTHVLHLTQLYIIFYCYSTIGYKFRLQWTINRPIFTNNLKLLVHIV